MKKDYSSAAAFELRFWLQVFGDHARFIYDSLGANEKQALEQAEYYKTRFDELLEAARTTMKAEAWRELAEKSYTIIMEIRAYKLNLLERHLRGAITLKLGQTFINHMVNEAEEAIRQIGPLVKGELPPLFNPVHYHLVWLLDAIGHSEALAAELDMTEKQLTYRSKAFAKQFTDFYFKAVEMAGFLRTKLDHFPALARFNKQSELVMLMFMQFLSEVEELSVGEEALSIFKPLLADHMYREECYYLTKLAEVSETKKPDCDPGKPRTEA